VLRFFCEACSSGVAFGVTDVLAMKNFTPSLIVSLME